jgi:spore maturation protein CgeB
MAQVGFSPPTRVFEAAGAGSCLITDYWEGIEMFFAPGREILPARSAFEVAEYLRLFGKSDAIDIGAAMRDRALREHTYSMRATHLHSILHNARNQRTGSAKADDVAAGLYDLERQ